MASITTWVRIEPRARDVDLAAGYAFQLRAGGTILTAPTQASGRVSWYGGDAATDSATLTQTTTPVVSTALPTRVHFRGAPARRYWDLDDGAVRWPAVTAGPGDVLRLLTVELGLTFADDWLVVPVELAPCSLARVVSHVVTDTFGIRQLVKATSELDGSNAWRFSEVARDPKMPGPLVLVVPGSSPAIGNPVDAIVFANDDVADTLWAIDRTVLAEDGIARTPATPGVPPGAGASLRYVLGPTIASIYHPYRERVGPRGLELALSTLPGVPLLDRVDLPPTLSVGALPSRPVQHQTAALLVRTVDGSYYRVMRHAVTPTQTPTLPALDFDQTRGGTS